MPSIINATTTTGVAITGDNSGNLAIQTNNGNTAVTIDTSQNVGIGTTTPNTKLNVQGSGNTYLNIRDTLANGYNAATLYTNTDRQFRVGTLGGVGGFTGGAFIVYDETAGAWRMVIDSSGDTVIGSTTASGKLRVFQTSTSDRIITASSPASYAATAFRSDSAATSGTGWYHLYGSSSGGSINNIFIYGNGNIENANNSYGAISDIKVKENIVDATPKLDKLMQVKVRNYNLKGEYDQHKQLGVIAQELETIFPSLIEETQDRGENDELLGTTTKSVKYSVFVPMLIKALQELNAKVDAQALEIQALKGVA